ncbi:MAG: serine hydrolase domain-containing protein [Ilumatobacteraceae bacterium]
MTRRFVPFLLLVASIVGVPTGVEASAATCKQILAKYPTGVVKTKAQASRLVGAGLARPVINAKVYAAARKLDRVNSGMLCIVEANKKVFAKGSAAPASTSVTDALVAPLPAVSAAGASAIEAARGTCLVAMRDGKIIGEWYWGGRTPSTRTIGYSTSKPLTAAVVGVAEKMGLLRLDQSVADFVPEWRGTPKAAITIRHLMTHTSGLSTAGLNLAQALTTAAGNSTSVAVGLPLGTAPGTTFNYDPSSFIMQVLIRVIEGATGEKFVTFAEKFILRPVGMASSSYLGDDPTTGNQTGDPWLAGGLQTTCRDLARLGQLFHLQGKWEGKQIFTPEYAAQANAAQVATPGYPHTAYGLLISHLQGGLGHGGFCGQWMQTLASGVTIAAMSTTTSLLESTTPLCAPQRSAALVSAVIAATHRSL